MSLEKFLDQVLFVIVVYRVQVDHTDAWTSLSLDLSAIGHNATVLIYDNGPHPQKIPASAVLDVHYHHDRTNAGVSAAYNHGHRLANKMKMSWMLLLDQDTRLPQGAIVKYSEATAAQPSQPVFAPVVLDQHGIVSPFEFRGARGVRISAPGETLPLRKYRAINSGLLVSLSLFEEVGGYDESIPLDFSDIAFLEKVSKVHDILSIIAVKMQHHLSGAEPRSTQESLERFEKKCQGASAMQRKLGNTRAFWLRSLLRAIKFSLLHLNFRFLAIQFQTWSR